MNTVIIFKKTFNTIFHTDFFKGTIFSILKCSSHNSSYLSTTNLVESTVASYFSSFEGAKGSII